MRILEAWKRRAAAVHPPDHRAIEVSHWNDIDRRKAQGERLFWLDHPRVTYHYYRKGEINGLQWQEWIISQFSGPAGIALELGCGSGASLTANLRRGLATKGIGVDLDLSRFTAAGNVETIASDLNTIQLERGRYDVIYALQSFHHFEAVEHIMEQVSAGLTDRGFFVLDEYVGPNRFQWTDLQLTWVGQLLALMSRNLRMYTHGIEKLAEGRSTPEQVMAVCPSEAVRSADLVKAFYENFEVVHHRNLGGTIQHLLYSGIVQNFPDHDPAIDHLIDCVDGIETSLIDHGVLPSDFVLLIGRRKSIQ
jgi:SAM-dependent methyltransferase